MKRDGKLSLALHALGHMAAGAPVGVQGGARPLRSEDMAAHNGTNAVVVRRVLGRLREAGIVQSEKGHAGGWRLARDPSTVTVAEVHEALSPGGDGGLLSHRLAGDGGSTTCVIERALHEAVDAALRDAEALLLRRLAGITVADLAAGMAAPDGTSGFAPTARVEP